MGGIIGIALWALVPGFIARSKGRSFGAYYFLSFLITPLITMIITICLKNNHITQENENETAAPYIPISGTISSGTSIADRVMKTKASQKMICPDCGAEYDGYQIVCLKCRAKLVPIESAADEGGNENETAAPGTPISGTISPETSIADRVMKTKASQKMICPNCGAEYDGYQIVCSKCRAKLVPIESAADESGNENERLLLCRHCGGHIDCITKKCISCGKKYFHISPLIFLIVVLSVLVVFLLGLLICQSLQQNASAEEMQAQITALKNDSSSKDSTIEEQQTALISLYSQVNELEKSSGLWQKLYERSKYKAHFMDEYVVIISDDGTRFYHKYDCPSLDLSSFCVYNTESAIQNGYRACPICNT